MRTVHEVLPLRVSVPHETGVIGRTLVLRLPEQEPKGVVRLLTSSERQKKKKINEFILCFIREVISQTSRMEHGICSGGEYRIKWLRNIRNIRNIFQKKVRQASQPSAPCTLYLVT